MPIREIPRNYRSVTGRIPSLKNGRTVSYESTLERDFFILQEFRPEVRRYEEQPLSIAYTSDGQQHRYIPDAVVEYCNSDDTNVRHDLIEVKYRAELLKRWHDLHPALRAGMRTAKARGWRFKIWTEADIRTPRLRVARRLMGFGRVAIPELAPVITNAVPLHGKTTIRDLVTKLDPIDERRVVWSVQVLIAKGILTLENREGLTLDSEIMRSIQDERG
jgi:hypothetical protein